jgi:hypothetical protein
MKKYNFFKVFRQSSQNKQTTMKKYNFFKVFRQSSQNKQTTMNLKEDVFFHGSLFILG